MPRSRKGQVELSSKSQQSDESQPASPSDASVSTIRFGPENLLRGIVFHVIDQGLARDVCVESLATTLTRLRRGGSYPTIRRTVWAEMTHHDRLEWLLAQSRTIPLIGEDDVVVLGSRDG